ncbi:hypothetical protein MGG_13101 [Pyricularia oryzae 70-15]|uniref:AB hydrolase-1 domain-containing protein n=1 Tax=Pyricularia oryzae (strain 70-15 / ATCC MYA-4617 / FGSC 8958) TaxID=242507 RepID=G4MM85_PYRO7|nr:uncharacterized protein MGG_13101 [Pyricularia oryzae 70-15]EHA57766.1 hypothetical protein MGG_13101 [Pyricularia oryzae 70-15]
MSTTTIVIIPGAWQKPVAWDRFIRELEAAGHKAILVSLPTVGGTELPLKSLEDDVAAVRGVLARLAEEKRDALLLCHSAGGLVASSAVEGVGNVAGVVYVTAFMVPRGRSLLDMMGGRPFDWMEVLEDRVLANPALLPQVAFNDLDGPTRDAAIEDMTHTSIKLFSSPCTYEPWSNGVKCGFVFCSEDNAVPLPIQQQMAAQLGPDAITATVKAGHCPFVSIPHELLDAVESVSRRLL